MAEDIKYYYDILNGKWWYFDILFGEWREYEEESCCDNVETNGKNDDNEIQQTEKHSDSVNVQYQNENDYDYSYKWKEFNYNETNEINDDNNYVTNLVESGNAYSSMNLIKDCPDAYGEDKANVRNSNKFNSLKNYIKNYHLNNKLDDAELVNKYYENSRENDDNAYRVNNASEQVNNYSNNYADSNMMTNKDLNFYENCDDYNVESSTKYYESGKVHNYDSYYNGVNSNVDNDTNKSNNNNNEYYNHKMDEHENVYEYNTNKNGFVSTPACEPHVYESSQSYPVVTKNKNNASISKIGCSDKTNLNSSDVPNDIEPLKKKNSGDSNDSNELSERINSLLHKSYSNCSSKNDNSELIEKKCSHNFTKLDRYNSLNTIETNSDQINGVNPDSKKYDEKVTKKFKINFQLQETYKNDEKKNLEKDNQSNKETVENENETKVIPFVRRATRTLTFKDQGGLSGCLKVFQEKKKELLNSSENEVTDIEIKIANLKRRARELAKKYKTKNKYNETEQKSDQIKNKFEDIVFQAQKHKKELQEKGTIEEK